MQHVNDQKIFSLISGKRESQQKIMRVIVTKIDTK